MAGGVHTITAKCDNCTNEATGEVKVPGCTVHDLTDIKLLSTLEHETLEEAQLTQQLEGGMDGYSLLSQATRNAEQCLAGRVNSVVGPPSTSGYKVTSTIRTPAYQAHLLEVWNKFWELKRKVAADTSLKQRCLALITKVEGEVGVHLTQDPRIDKCDGTLSPDHCIVSSPAGANPKHVQNIAFDISRSTINAFKLRRNVRQEANACGLTWGGTFTPIDEVHFVLQ